MKNTVSTFKEQKVKGEKITMLTAYDYSTAKLMDQSGINGILVGDSLGMVMLGYENTLPVTMERYDSPYKSSYKRGAKDALVVEICRLCHIKFQLKRPCITQEDL